MNNILGPMCMKNEVDCRFVKLVTLFLQWDSV